MMLLRAILIDIIEKLIDQRICFLIVLLLFKNIEIDQ